MSETVEILLLDLLEWLTTGEHNYDEVMQAWRTSCPRFPIWEEANERGLVAREFDGERCRIRVTASGIAHLSRLRPRA